LAAIVPATRGEHVRGADGEVILIGKDDRAGGDQFGTGALGVGEVLFADFFADGDDDALPSDHGAQAEREGDGKFYPPGNKLGEMIQLLLVAVPGIGKERDLGGIVYLSLLDEFAYGRADEVNVGAKGFALLHGKAAEIIYSGQRPGDVTIEGRNGAECAFAGVAHEKACNP
jgi:hypothetical protein